MQSDTRIERTKNMGFGLLFLGYTLPLMPLPYLLALPDCIGYIIMIVALKKLSPNNNNFKYSGYILYPMLAISLTNLIIQSIEFLNEFVTPISLFKYSDVVVDRLNFSILLFNLLFHYFLLNALIEIANFVGNKKIVRKCNRNKIITFVYLIYSIVVGIPLGIPSNIFQYIIYVYNIVYYPVFILNAIQIFSCYMWICYEGDEEMPTPDRKSFFKKKADSDETEDKPKKSAKKGE